ncbi:MAG: protein translocase subunit SecF [Methylobacteriaceae bacterium]|nr:protein translocase subunit SecF [Methylobacteriaceae bacterium]
MRLLRIVPDGTRFGFVRFRRFSFPFSAALSVATVIMFLQFGLHFGIDFTGGTLIELQAKSGKADVGAIRTAANAFGVGEVQVQEFGNAGGVSLRFPVVPGGDKAQGAGVQKAHEAFDKDYEFRRVETVGPRVSGELVQSGTLGVVLSIIAVLTYLWLRFEHQFAFGAIIGTMHDIVLTIGFFVITRTEFNMTSIAAILTIVGYSLNETVVVFDRTRELLRRYKTMPVRELLDLSVNTTLSRTAMTATSAFLSLLALVLFGGSAIEGFAIVMLFGVVVCTYSAMFISSPALMYLGIRAEGSVPAEAEPEKRSSAKAAA